MPSFSIITPTVGRPELARALASAARQLGPYDEHIVVGDGRQLEAQAMALAYRHTRYIETPKTGGFGAVQRDAGIMQATGDYLIFLDDDDVLVDGILPAVREIVAETPGALFLFRARFYGYGAIPDGTVLWRDEEIRDGNVRRRGSSAPTGATSRAGRHMAYCATMPTSLSFAMWLD